MKVLLIHLIGANAPRVIIFSPSEEEHALSRMRSAYGPLLKAYEILEADCDEAVGMIREAVVSYV